MVVFNICRKRFARQTRCLEARKKNILNKVHPNAGKLGLDGVMVCAKSSQSSIQVMCEVSKAKQGVWL